MNKILIAIALNLLFCNCLSAQHDSSAIRRLRLSVGYKDYSSINEIFNPYKYTALSPDYSTELTSLKGKNRFEIFFGYSFLKRSPENLNVPSYYNLINYNNGMTYRMDVDQEYLQEIRTNYLHFRSAYFRKFKTDILFHDILYLGISNEDLFILNPSLGNPEMISISLNPAFIYEIYLKNNWHFSFKNQMALLSLTIQRPYSGAEAQLDQKRNFKYYKDYVLKNALVCPINKYYLYSSHLAVEKEFNTKISLNAEYVLQVQGTRQKRRFTAAETVFTIGLGYKI